MPHIPYVGYVLQFITVYMYTCLCVEKLETKGGGGGGVGIYINTSDIRIQTLQSHLSFLKIEPER